MSKTVKTIIGVAAIYLSYKLVYNIGKAAGDMDAGKEIINIGKHITITRTKNA